MINDFTLAHANRKKKDKVYNENNITEPSLGAKNVFDGFNSKTFYEVNTMSVKEYISFFAKDDK